VAFDHITLDRGGAVEDLFLDQSKPVQAITPGTPPSPGAAAAGGIPVGQIRSEIGFIPRIDAGRVSGLVVRSQGTGALFRQAGLREGDVVTSIGGRPVAGADDLDRIAADFRAGGNIPLQVERGNQTLTLALTVAPTQ
jgi:general secretion pathway protein C